MLLMSLYNVYLRYICLYRENLIKNFQLKSNTNQSTVKYHFMTILFGVGLIFFSGCENNAFILDLAESDNSSLILFAILQFLLIVSFIWMGIILRNKLKYSKMHSEENKDKISNLIKSISLLNKKLSITILMYDISEDIIYELKDGDFRRSDLTFSYFISRIQANDKVRFLKEYHSILNGLNKESILELQIYVPEDDRYHYYELTIHAQKIDQNGRVSRILCSKRENTEQKELINAQMEMIENLNLAISSGKLIRWQYDINQRLNKFVDHEQNEYYFSVKESFELLHPDDISTLAEYMRNLGDNKNINITIRVKQKFGYIHFDIYAMMQYDESGKAIGLHGVLKNVSDAYSYQSLLKEKIDLLKAMNNNMPVGMFFYDKDGYIKDLNESLVLFLGIDKNKMLNSKKNLFSMDYLPDDVIELLKKGEQAQYELKYESISKTLKEYIVDTNHKSEVFDVRCAPVKNEKEEIIGFITIYNDITEMHKDKLRIKELQNDTSLALEAGGMSAWRYDCEKERFYSLYGGNAYDGSLSEDQFMSLVHPNERTHLYGAMESIKSGEKLKVTVTFRLRSRKGWKWLMCSLTTLPGQEKVKFITGTRRDITDEMEAKEILEKSNKELEIAKRKAEESERLKMAFLANMSHEIRTPLNAIVGFSELVHYAENETERNEYLKIISINNELLLRIINDILNLSKIESGSIEIKNEVFEVSNVLNEVILSFVSRAQKKDISIINDIRGQKYMVYLDKERLIQIVSNFISNALKYTKSGSVKIGMKYENSGISIYVKDTGIGIDDNQKHLIFKRFEKLDSFAQGTGLGLAICKAMTIAMNGKIGFDSQKDEGSKFWVWFPIDSYVIEKESLNNHMLMNGNVV